MDIENMNVRLTADADGFNAAIDGARNSLSDFAIEERSLQAQQAVLNREITANADKIEMLGRRCGSLSQTIANQNRKIQQAVSRYGENSVQVTRLRTGLERLKSIYDAYNAKLTQAQQHSTRLAQQLLNVQAREQQLKETVRNTNNSLEQQQKAFAQTAVSGGNLGNQLKSTFLMLKGLAVGYAGKTLFNALVGSNAEYEQSMTSFEVLLQSADKADKLMSEMTEFAAKTPFEMSDLQKGAQTLLAFGTSEDEVIEKMRQLGDLSQGMPDKFERITSAYGKMNAKGKVSLEELNMLTEAGVPILRQLAEQSGISQEQLFKNISDGELRIEDINKAIEELTAEGGQFFGMMEKQSETMSGMWSNLTDNVNIFAREVGEETFDVLKNELSELLNTIDNMSDSGELSDMAREWGQNIANFVRIITGAIEIIYKMRSVIIGVGTAWATWKTLNTVVPVINSTVSAIRLLSTVIQLGATKQQFQNLVDGKTVLLKNNVTGAITIETAAKAREITATDGATVSQLKFNAALLANPYTVVAVVLGALVTGLIAYNQHLDSVKQAEQQARSEAVQTANEYQEQRKSIDELTKKYKELAVQTNIDESAKQELKSVQEQLNSLFDSEGEKLDLVNGKYEEQIEKIQNLSREKAKDTAREMYGSYEDAKKNLTQNKIEPRDDNTLAFAIGNAFERLQQYDEQIKYIEQLKQQQGELYKVQKIAYREATKSYTDLKKEIIENIRIIDRYYSALIRSGQITATQVEKEKIEIAGSIEKWNELTSTQDENTASTVKNGNSTSAATDKQSTALDKIKNKLSAVQTALSELDKNKKIKISTMEDLIEFYPDLIEYLNDEKALHDTLIKKENEEKNNYVSALQEKYINTVLFGDNVSAENKKLIDNLAKA